MKDSYGRINRSMNAAVKLAIGSGLKFQRSVFVAIYKDFNGGRWMNDNGEWVYAMAIAVGNNSCVEAYEAFQGREPFIANDPMFAYGETCGFIHRRFPTRSRSRVAVGMAFKLDGFYWQVTSIEDSKGVVRFARYESGSKKPKQLRSATNAEFAKLFPAPKKAAKI